MSLAVIAAPSPSLPSDILREVLARCDHETLVRCAASSRLLCRCMSDDPAFLRRHAAAGGRYAPSLLLGLFHFSSRRDGTRFIEAPEPAVVPRETIRAFLSNNTELLKSFDEPGTCRDGLVVLRRGRSTKGKTDELCVCEPMTGRRCLLPGPPEVYDQSLALLVGENASASSPFQLLAVNMSLVVPYAFIQLFSSPQPFPAIMPGGAWGPECRVAVPRRLNVDVNPMHTPVVIDRVAHWLSRTYGSSYDVLALHVDAERVEMIQGPWKHHSQSKPSSVMLATTADRRLSLVAVEELVISMWVLSEDKPAACWEQNRTVVREGAIEPPKCIRLDWFGERSGAVVMSMDCLPGMLVLNLETREVAHMPAEDSPSTPAYLYEMDLTSLVTALDGIGRFNPA